MILKTIQEKLKRTDLSALLIVDPINLRYVTGLTLSSAALIVGPSSAYLFVDRRYALMAESLNSSFQIHVGTRSDIRDKTVRILEQIRGKIGFDGANMSYGYHQNLLHQSSSLSLTDSPLFFSHLRRQKSPEEVSKIQAACRICEKGVAHLLNHLRPGVTEKQLERELKLFWFTHGADDISFPPIIAFGPNSACPHWECSETPLKKNSVILIDIGVQKNGYHSDMSRVIFYGDVGNELQACWKHVEETFRKVVELAKPGILPYELDRYAREHLASCGYEKAFSHGLGHGVGMQIHEHPRLSPEMPDEGSLEIGDVITIEPGLYLEGKGGIRLEDTFVVEKEGVRSLFSLPSELIQIDV